MRALIAAMGVGLAVAGGAQSQPLKKTAPIDTGAYRAQATTLIKSAEATSLFVAGASPGGPLAQHVKSNMVCHFEPGSPANRIEVFDSGPSRGDDVGCATQLRDIKVTVFANRAPQADALARLQAEANAGVKRQWPSALPYKGEIVVANDKDRPQVLISRFIVGEGQTRLYVRTAAVRVGDWVFTQKAVAPEASAKAAEFYAEASLTFLYREAKVGRPL
jgi:hypothetical protein